jgi:hypothetical protein
MGHPRSTLKIMADAKRQKLDEFISFADDENNEIKVKEIGKEIEKFEKKIVLNDERRSLKPEEWIERYRFGWQLWLCLLGAKLTCTAQSSLKRVKYVFNHDNYDLH